MCHEALQQQIPGGYVCKAIVMISYCFLKNMAATIDVFLFAHPVRPKLANDLHMGPDGLHSFANRRYLKFGRVIHRIHALIILKTII